MPLGTFQVALSTQGHNTEKAAGRRKRSPHKPQETVMQADRGASEMAWEQNFRDPVHPDFRNSHLDLSIPHRESWESGVLYCCFCFYFLFFNMTSNPFFIQNLAQSVMCSLEENKAVPVQILPAVTAEILAAPLGSALGCFKPTRPCSECWQH